MVDFYRSRLWQSFVLIFSVVTLTTFGPPQGATFGALFGEWLATIGAVIVYASIVYGLVWLVRRAWNRIRKGRAYLAGELDADELQESS